MNHHAKRRARAQAMLNVLKHLFPKAGIMLRFRNNFELLVAVILSARCTDKKVNEVTARLFKKYRALSDYAEADQRALERDIRPTGFYRNKAKHIIAAARAVRDRFGGKVPRTMEEMLTIPGVARKTANVVLGNAHGVVEGIAVDTHVRRLALKFGLTDHPAPRLIEQDLMELIPKKDWFRFTYYAIEYGRNVCPARRHDCGNHPLTKLYPRAAARWPRAA